MFLFTTPPTRETTAPATPVVEAIRQGAQRSGTDFSYLLATAQRESALDPKARAGTSSATGLFQFIEQTWLGTLKADGERLGLAEQAAAITRRRDGSLEVADPALRRQILALREDPGVSAALAGALTQRNREQLATDLGREPNAGELYVAHVLGARGASTLIRAASASPARPAASDFPDAAAANRSIFYDRSGRARGAGEVLALLSSQHDAATPATPIAAPAGPPPVDGPAFHGLFRTATRSGAVSEAVARLWQGRAGEGQRTAALNFFPRSTGAEPLPAPVPEPAVEPEAGSPARPTAAVPLPPPRPDSLGPAWLKAGRPAGQPLDLGTFMTGRART